MKGCKPITPGAKAGTNCMSSKLLPDAIVHCLQQ